MFEDSPFDALSNETNELILNRWLERCQAQYFPDVEPVVRVEVTKVSGPGCLLRDKKIIQVHPAIASWTKLSRIVILHELIHWTLWKRDGDSDAEEGERFQAEVNRLWQAGAYRGLL